jgi:lycopene cyclase domain-containing protein
LDRFQYLIVMAACALLTLPLEFVFEARVWRRPRRLVATLAPVLLVFGTWDAFAIARDHWGFNARYVTGWRVPFSIPVEEVAFFVVIPVCALLTFEAITRIVDRRSA